MGVVAALASFEVVAVVLVVVLAHETFVASPSLDQRDLLHQLALRADAVQHLQQYGAQQLFGRDTGAAALDVGFGHFGEQAIHLIQLACEWDLRKYRILSSAPDIVRSIQRQNESADTWDRTRSIG